jgi:hypothetical protein
MKNGFGSKIFELAGVLQAIAEASDDPVYYVLPHPVGGFGQTLTATRALTNIPILPENVRKKLTSTVNEATQEGSKALDTIATELCKESGKINHQNLMIAVGSLYKYAMLLSEEQRALSPPRGHGHEEEE